MSLQTVCHSHETNFDPMNRTENERKWKAVTNWPDPVADAKLAEDEIWGEVVSEKYIVSRHSP